MDALLSLGNIAVTAVVFMLVITVLVAVHELGHYWFARMFGMHVEAFAVMMGGVRRTDLTPYLSRPLAPARTVWMAAGLAFLGCLGGAMAQNVVLFDAGLLVLGVVIPVWIALRIERLYHLPLWAGVKPLAVSWAAALVLMFIATRFQGVGPTEIIGLLTCGSAIGLLIVYYTPVMGKSEETPQGHGKLSLRADERLRDVDFQSGPVWASRDEDGKGFSIDGRRDVDVRFGPVWATRDKHGTEFSILALPLGGFAAIKGMHPRADGSEVSIEQGFYSKSPGARFWVLFAGPLFSIVFGLLVLTGVYGFGGIPKASNEPVIGALAPDGPAAKAGLKVGDRIVEVNGKPVTTFYGYLQEVRGSFRETDGQREPVAVQIGVRRGAETFTVRATPTVDTAPTPVIGPDLTLTAETRVQAKLGALWEDKYVPVGLVGGFQESLRKPVEMVQGLAGIVLRPSTAKDQIGGPGTMAVATQSAVQGGLYRILMLAGLLSISLGVMNLLPFPPLDGGQIVIALIEMFRGGKRLSLRVQTALANVGMLFVLLLMVTAFTIDIGRFTGTEEKPNASSR